MLKQVNNTRLQARDNIQRSYLFYKRRGLKSVLFLLVVTMMPPRFRGVDCVIV